MKKRTVVIIIIIAALLAAAFIILAVTGVLPIFSNEKSAGATLAVEEYLGRNEPEDEPDSGFIIPDLETTADRIDRMILDNVEYAVLSISDDYIELKITSLDLRAIMDEVTESVRQEHYADNEFDEAKEYAQSLMTDIIEEGGRGKVTNTVKVAYSIQDGEYVIEESEDFINAVYGGMLDALESYNEALGIE